VHVELAGDLEELDQDPAHGDIPGRSPEDRLAHRPQGLGEVPDGAAGGDVTGFEVNAGHPLGSRAAGSPEDFREVAALVGSQPADNAEVHRLDPVGR
jgi:hypothetical protein